MILAPLRNRFGIPGVISVIALVFAMFGGAYAASNSGQDGGKAAARAKTKKGPRGPRGPAGPAGPQGAVGPMGPAGPAGTQGGAGASGVSATTASFSGEKGGCTAGGVEVKSASAPTLICNGSEGDPGTPGPEGDPWVAGTAPSGKVMKGTWVLPPATASDAGEFFYTAISTGVPINALNELSEPLAIFSGAPFCLGSAEDPEPPAHPVTEQLLPGAVCVYTAVGSNISPSNGNGKLRSSGGGAVAAFTSDAAGPVSGYGSWAMGTP